MLYFYFGPCAFHACLYQSRRDLLHPQPLVPHDGVVRRRAALQVGQRVVGELLEPPGTGDYLWGNQHYPRPLPRPVRCAHSTAGRKAAVLLDDPTCHAPTAREPHWTACSCHHTWMRGVGDDHCAFWRDGGGDDDGGCVSMNVCCCSCSRTSPYSQHWTGRRHSRPSSYSAHRPPAP